MCNGLLKVYVFCQMLADEIKKEDGQDLVEYAVVCLGIIAGMNTLARGINTAMNSLSTKLNSAVA